jgi:hypothetical protein
MRINAFVSFDPLFSEINTVLEHSSTADIVEDKSGELFEFPYQNINVISGRTYRSSIENGSLLTLVSNMFDSTNKTEANFGVRIMNGLAPTSRLISAFANNLPSGSRLFFVKKQDISSVVQYYQELYDTLTTSTARQDQMRRKVLFCLPGDTLTHQQISDSIYETADYVDAYFSTINASNFNAFKKSDYISGGSETNTNLLYRVHVIP